MEVTASFITINMSEAPNHNGKRVEFICNIHFTKVSLQEKMNVIVSDFILKTVPRANLTSRIPSDLLEYNSSFQSQMYPRVGLIGFTNKTYPLNPPEHLTIWSINCSSTINKLQSGHTNEFDEIRSTSRANWSTDWEDEGEEVAIMLVAVVLLPFWMILMDNRHYH